MKSIMTTLAVCALGITASALEGNFSSGCQQLQLDETRTIDLVDSFETDGATFKAPYTRFDSTDGTCQTPALSASLEGTVAIVDETALGGDVGHMDQTLQNYFVTLHTQAEVDAFNERKLCQYDQWALETQVDVFDLDCTGVISISRGDTIYTIFKDNGDSISLGAATEAKNGTSEELRHDQMNPATYNRQ